MIDVAKRAGVSLATVSRVLNNSKYVDEDLRRRVELAVEELNYQPDLHARWLSSKRSNVVGLIIPSVEDSNLAAFLHACTTALRERDFDVMVALSDGDKRLEVELITAQVQSHVSAIIFIPRVPDSKTRGLLSRTSIPVLYALTEDPSASAPAIVFNDHAAARALMERTRPESGKCVILTAHAEDSITANRVAGYTAAFEAAGAAPPEVVECDSEMDGGYAATRTILEAEAPRLLATTSDYLAISAVRAAHDMGVAVPSELSVLGFGENIYSHTCSPSITTVRLDGRELGTRCGTTIVSLLDGGEAPRVERLGFELVPGESCPLRGFS
jgi:LacI family transcriptional regulator